MPECTDYIVRFFKGNSMHQLHILAHNKEQAEKLAIMQSKYSKMGAGKFELISIRKDGEPDPIEEAYKKISF